MTYKSWTWKLKPKSVATIRINGTTIVTEGSSVSIVNGKVSVDGKMLDTKDMPVINVTVTGDVKNIDADAANRIEVTGNVTGSVKTMSGDVQIDGNVGGNVSTMSGDVDAHQIEGSVSSMSGNIKTRK